MILLDCAVASNCTKESKVQLENVKFHVHVGFKRFSNEEIPVCETILHKHVYYELFVCKQGKISIKTAQENILLTSGDIAIIPPTKSHVLKYATENSQVYFLSFLCKKSTIESSVNLYRKLTPILNSEIQIFKNSPDFVLEIEKTVEELLFNDNELFWGALQLLELLLKIVDIKNIKEADEKTKKSAVTSNEIESMIKLERMIANGYLYKYSASDYAKELFISTRQLDRIAIKNYGKTIHQLIVDKRVELAEQLLLTTDLSVESVALSSGFNSSASLYREFKKRRGVTPSMFRKT